MKVLTPFEVFFLANSVYGIRTTPRKVLEYAYNEKTLPGFPGVKAPFDPATLNAFTGRSGVRFAAKSLQFLSSSSGFGFLAKQTAGAANEYVLVTRGTDIVPDWLTDADVGIAIGPNHKVVHKGFHDTFKSYLTQLDVLLRQVGPPPAIIHCVGHSLGGALANLNAALLHERGVHGGLVHLGCTPCGPLPVCSRP